MDAKAFRDMSAEELDQKLRDLREDLFKLKLRASATQLENPSRIRQLRRDIARGETVRREFSRRQGTREEVQAS